MQIAHSFLSILAGFIVMVGLTGIATALLRRFAPSLIQVDTRPDALAMLRNVGLTFLFSTLAGYITARHSQVNPMADACMMAMVVLLLSAVSPVQMKGK